MLRLIEHLGKSCQFHRRRLRTFFAFAVLCLSQLSVRDSAANGSERSEPPAPRLNVAASDAASARAIAAQLHCAGSDILSTVASGDGKGLGDTDDSGPTLEMNGNVGDIVTLLATGPKLDSFYSRDVKVTVACSARGVTIEMMVTKLLEDPSSALKNVLWRPLVTVALTRRRSLLHVESTWRLRLLGGGELSHDKPLGLPELEYPASAGVTLSPRRTGKARDIR